MSASTQSADAPMSRSRTTDLDRNERSLTRSSSSRQQTTESKKSSQPPRTASGAPDDAHAGRHAAFVKPRERTASRAQHDERSATSRAKSPISSRRPNYTIDTQQARERLDKKLKRLEPQAWSDEASRPRSYRDQAEDQPHERQTLAEQHDPMNPRGGIRSAREYSHPSVQRIERGRHRRSHDHRHGHRAPLTRPKCGAGTTNSIRN